MRYLFSLLILCSLCLCNAIAEIISYDDEEVVEDFLVLPNEEGNHSFNVRFTPEEGQFQIIGMQIALFDNYGDAGNPGMKISFSESENGHPCRDIIDSLDVPSDSLVLSGEEIVWNEIRFPELNLTFFGRLDFHIIVNVLQNEEWDTLAVFLDNGEFLPTDRSGIWSTEEGQWVHLIDLYEMGHNFLIRAIVDYDVEENDAPVISSPIPDITIQMNSGLTEIANLGTVFFDPDGDNLSFRFFGPPELNLAINRANILTVHPEQDFTQANIPVRVSADDQQGNDPVYDSFNLTVSPLSVQDWESGLPGEITLYSCYPNPFNPVLNLPFFLPKSDMVEIDIYDIRGLLISKVSHDYFEKGDHVAVWNADEFTAGVYFVNFATTDLSIARKVVLMK